MDPWDDPTADGSVPWDIPRRLTRPVPGGGRQGGSWPMGSPERAAGLPPPLGGVGGAQLLERLPQEFPPPGATWFNRFGNITGLTSGGSPATVASLFTQVPSSNVAVVRSLTLNVNSMVTTTDITYDVLVNDAPPVGWGGLTIFPRNAGSVSVSWEAEVTLIWIPENGTIDVRFTVADAGTYQVGASYMGWTFSLATAERYGLSGVI